jgi:hypothetical protein
MVAPIGTPAAARRAQVVEVARHLVKFLRADDQVDVGQLVEQLGPAVLRHAAEDPEHEVRLLPLALLRGNPPCRWPSARRRRARCTC